MRTTQDRQQPTLGVLLLSNGIGKPGWLSDTLEPPMDGDANSPKGCILVPTRAAENYITNLIKSAQDEREETYIRVLDYPYYQTH